VRGELLPELIVRGGQVGLVVSLARAGVAEAGHLERGRNLRSDGGREDKPWDIGGVFAIKSKDEN
jgi:hypothetical protein